MKKLLKSLPFPKGETITLIDIGARWGINPPWDGVDSEYITYYGFEPDKEECDLLNNKELTLPSDFFNKKCLF